MTDSTASLRLEGIKLAIEFVKQITTISAQLATFVSGGIYFLSSKGGHISRLWLYALVLLITAIAAGLVAFGSIIGQINKGEMNIVSGSSRTLALAQIILFFAALLLIIAAGIVNANVLH